MKAFERAGLCYGDEIVARERGTNSAFGGFLERADAHAWEFIPIVSVWATPSGMVTADALSPLVSQLQEGLRQAIAGGGLDGVLLGLHGAMVSELDSDGDAYILEA